MPRYLLNVDEIENTANSNIDLDAYQSNASDYASLGPQTTMAANRGINPQWKGNGLGDSVPYMALLRHKADRHCCQGKVTFVQ